MNFSTGDETCFTTFSFSLQSRQDPPEKKKVEDIMDDVGDADIVICDNLERALFLSLKYEFVTPLTSLVVVKPDSKEKGSFDNADDLADKVSML
jgi:hypothetical protein